MYLRYLFKEKQTETHTERSRKWKGSCEKQKQKCTSVQKRTDKKVWSIY